MKKLTAIAAAAVLLLSGCGNSAPAQNETAAPAENKETLKIVATIFPEYDWIMNILGDSADQAEVTVLLNSGVDLHSYQPTADDILKITDCDVFVYVGGESDDWVEDALKSGANPDRLTVNLLEVLGDEVVEEEIVEGMEHEHEEGEEHEHEEGEEHDHEHEAEYDEHVWLSLRKSAKLCSALADTLGQADPDNAAVYRENADAYIAELNALDAEYTEAVNAAPLKTFLFGDRFPFRYLAEDYGLEYYGAFAGCSAETEASFETIIFLANKVDELSLPVILTIDGSDGKIAETVRSNTASKDQEILVMDSLQAATTASGVSYLEIMEKNLEVLRKALGSN